VKTSKVYPNLQTFYYRPEFNLCLECGASLKRSHTAWRKTITTLNGTAKVFNQAYRCRDQDLCAKPEQVYRSAYADGLSIPYYTYGLDVIVYIGQQRLREHQTIAEIHTTLRQKEPSVLISEREVQYLFDVYLLLSACSHGQRLEKYRSEIEANGGIVLAIDGAKPEKGQPGLYLFRDALSGCRLHSAILQSADADSLRQELGVVKGLGLPVQAIISDDEKATVAAVAAEFPGKPHGLCHTHFLKAAQKPVYEADRQLVKELKHPVRAMTKVERLLRHQPQVVEELSTRQQQALRHSLDAIRAVLLTKGQTPFRLAGTAIYEALAQLTESLTRSQGHQDHLILEYLHRLTETYQTHQATYDRVQRQQAWFLGLAELLDVSLTETQQWPTQTGAEVAQTIADYLDTLDTLRDELSEDASFFSHLRRRVEQWGHGLYWTYEIPALPRTNNALEVDIGDVKEQYRRITGRRSLKDYLMRYGPYLTFDDDRDDPEELLQWFREIDRQDFVSEKAKLEALREHLRNMQRFRQNPEEFLAEAERLWNDSG
jgi:hypothetical protein